MPRVEIPHFSVRGISRATAPHEIPLDKWFDSLNFRFKNGETTQIPRRVLHTRLSRAFRFPVTALCTLPLGEDRVAVVAFAGSKVFRLLYSNTLQPLDGDNAFLVGKGTARWAVAPHEGRLFATNLLNPVASVDGTIVKKFSGPFVPSARYISVFYDHVVVAHVSQSGSYHPYRLQWSDLYNVDKWEPGRTNEADHYDCLERARLSENVLGITGLSRLGDSLWTYTPSYIFRSDYVGLPRVFSTRPAVSGLGCDFPYGLVSSETEHIFPNGRRGDFFSNRDGKIESVGKEIFPYLLENINPAYAKDTWSFYHEAEDEAWWVFVSKNSTTFDRAIVFSMSERTWYPASAEDLFSYCAGGVIAEGVNELLGKCDALSGPPNLLGASKQVLGLWGGSNSRIYRDEVEGDADSSLVHSEVPFLETQDFTYDTKPTIKEADNVILDAAGGEVRVEVDNKRLLSQPTAFVEQLVKWSPDVRDGAVSFPRVSGRSFRYRFTPSTEAAARLPFSTLFCEIETYVYPTFKEVFVGGEATPVGAFHPKYTGTYTVEAIAAGGGGGGQALLPYQTGSCDLVPNSIYPIRETSEEKLLAKTFVGFPVGLDATILMSGTSYKLALPYVAGEDPNFGTGVSRDVRDAICRELVRAAEQFVTELNGTLVSFYCFFFARQSIGTGVNILDWFNKVPTVVPFPAGAMVPGVKFVWMPSNQRAWRRAGGGSGGWLRANVPINDIQTEKIYYSIGLAAPSTRSGGHVLGASGGNTAVSSLNWSITVKGGLRGGYDYVSATFIDGLAGGAALVAGLASYSEQQGDNARAEVPASGAPVTVTARGGRGFREGRELSVTSGRTYYRDSDQKGFEYGGGGRGVGDSYETDLLQTAGAHGLVAISFRKDPVGNVAYGLPAAFLNLNKRALKTKVSSSFKVGGEPSLLYNVLIRVYAVTELFSFGGTPVAKNVVRGGSDFGAPVSLKLETGRETFFLNDGDSGGIVSCSVVDTSFIISVYGQSTLILTQDNKDGFQSEPRSNLFSFLSEVAEGSDLHEPQFCVVEVEPLNPTAHPIRGFSWKGFVEHIYGVEAEK